jgi:hypothetical protein
MLAVAKADGFGSGFAVHRVPHSLANPANAVAIEGAVSDECLRAVLLADRRGLIKKIAIGSGRAKRCFPKTYGGEGCHLQSAFGEDGRAGEFQIHRVRVARVSGKHRRRRRSRSMPRLGIRDDDRASRGTRGGAVRRHHILRPRAGAGVEGAGIKDLIGRHNRPRRVVDRDLARGSGFDPSGGRGRADRGWTELGSGDRRGREDEQESESQLELAREGFHGGGVAESCVKRAETEEISRTCNFLLRDHFIAEGGGRNRYGGRRSVSLDRFQVVAG